MKFKIQIQVTPQGNFFFHVYFIGKTTQPVTLISFLTKKNGLNKELYLRMPDALNLYLIMQIKKQLGG